jgi:hypothetical protein
MPGPGKDLVESFKQMVSTVVNKTAIGRVPAEMAKIGRKIKTGRLQLPAPELLKKAHRAVHSSQPARKARKAVSRITSPPKKKR